MDDQDSVTLRVLDADHTVPAGITVLNALARTGRPWLLRAGCRVGDCGECAVTYRLPGDTAPRRDYACVLKVAEGMAVLDIPFPWALAFQRARAAG